MFHFDPPTEYELILFSAENVTNNISKSGEDWWRDGVRVSEVISLKKNYLVIFEFIYLNRFFAKGNNNGAASFNILHVDIYHSSGSYNCNCLVGYVLSFVMSALIVP